MGIYEHRGRLDNPYNTHGYRGTLVFSFLVARTVSVEAGGSYYNQQGHAYYDLNRRSAFVSLRYQVPEVYRF